MNDAVLILFRLEKEKREIEKRIETLKSSLSASGDDVTHIEAQVEKRLKNVIRDRTCQGVDFAFKLIPLSFEHRNGFPDN